MSQSLTFSNIEVEDTVVLNALIETLKNNKELVKQLKSQILGEMEVLDTRNEEERQRVES